MVRRPTFKHAAIPNMSDIYDRQTRSKVMACIRKADTRPELAVRRLLHRLGFRFRLHQRNLPGTPDVVLPRYRTVIFVQGCFWHQHSCALGKVPRSNREYWLPKLKRNRARDADNIRRLRALEWRVIVLWECEVANQSRLQTELLWRLNRKASH